MKALYVGRFQPFHFGHLKVVSDILSKTSEIIIAVGSAQYSHTIENPFTAGERISMIKLALNTASIEPLKYFIVPVPDTNIHSVWVAHLESYVPHFDLVFSNNPLTRRLFVERGFRVEQVPFYKREIYSSTEIRSRMLDGRDWEILVPEDIVQFIKKIGGVKRLRDLAVIDSILKKDTK